MRGRGKKQLYLPWDMYSSLVLNQMNQAFVQAVIAFENLGHFIPGFEYTCQPGALTYLGGADTEFFSLFLKIVDLLK
jgi:hypothetical protein